MRFQKLFLIAVSAALLCSQADAQGSHSGSGRSPSLAGFGGTHVGTGHRGAGGVSISSHGSPRVGLSSGVPSLSQAATHGIGGFPVGLYGNRDYLGSPYGNRGILGGLPGSFIFGNTLAGQGALGGSNVVTYVNDQAPGFGSGIVPGSQNLGSFGFGTNGVGLGGYSTNLNYPLPNTGFAGFPSNIGYPAHNTGAGRFPSTGYPVYNNGLGALPFGAGYPVSGAGLGGISSGLAASAGVATGK